MYSYTVTQCERRCGSTASVTAVVIPDNGRCERARIAWHYSDDFAFVSAVTLYAYFALRLLGACVLATC